MFGNTTVSPRLATCSPAPFQIWSLWTLTVQHWAERCSSVREAALPTSSNLCLGHVMVKWRGTTIGHKLTDLSTSTRPLRRVQEPARSTQCAYPGMFGMDKG